jgi:hypothetical protein
MVLDIVHRERDLGVIGVSGIAGLTHKVLDVIKINKHQSFKKGLCE